MASYLSMLIQAAEPANYKLNYDEHYMISVPFATTTTPGIVAFDSDYFKVVNGVVSLSDEYAGNLNNILNDIADLQEGKVDKIVPEDAGIFAYVVRKVMGQVIDYAIQISQDADADTIAMRYTNGRLKVGDGVDNADAVNKAQLTAATTDIPKSALASDVRTSLGKADTAYQKPSTGIPETDLASAVRAKLNKAISRVGISPEDWETLPVADRDINTMYFVGPYGTAPNQYFVEWMYFVDPNDVGTWEAVGSTQSVDLSNYFTKSEINALLAGKANIDGVYSGMSVGHADIADQINTDREIEDADTACPPVVFGTVGGAAEVQNGYMRFPELRGHTIKWNQLVQNGNFDDITGWSAGSGSLSVADNIATVTASSGLESNFRLQQTLSKKAIYGHKGLFVFTARKTYDDSLTVRVRYPAQTSAVYLTATFQRIGLIATIDASGDNLDLFWIQGFDGSTGAGFEVMDVNFFDLTEIYGAGNEPSTVAEFARDFPLPYYAYNAGTLLSSKSSSVDFVKRNQWDEEWEVGAWVSGQKVDTGTGIRSKNIMPILPGTTYYCGGSGIYITIFDGNGNYISRTSYSNETFVTDVRAAFFAINSGSTYGTTYNHDICIYINWETPGLPYVAYSKQTITLPNLELRSAGSAYDVLYQQGGGKRRVGTYTFDGAETWYQGGSQTSAGMYRYYMQKDIGMKHGTALDGLCNAFENLGADWNTSTQEGVFFGVGGNELVQFVTSSAKTQAEIQAIFNSSVTIFFPLATETDITVEENPGWDEYAEIDNFGTVKFNQDPAQTIPVPQAYFIRYTVNLVEFLDSLYVHCGGDVSKIALTS